MTGSIQSEDTNLILRCRELNDVASKVELLLKPRMESLAQDSLVYTFKSRIKGPGSILSKVKRKRHDAKETDDNASYAPDHVTDAWGCRYVTLYQSQIPPTVHALLSDFDRHNETGAEKIELLEFVIYTNRPEKDPLSITKETRDILKSCKISSGSSTANVKPPENRKSAYSSVHLVFSLPVVVEHPGRGEVREDARFEVQVRDIFEEGWGEIQHNLIYSGKDRINVKGDTDPNFDPLWQPHLNALKTFVDGCSQHASIIKKTYDFIHYRRMPSIDTESATPQSTDRDAIVAALGSQTTRETIGMIELAYGLLLDAQKAESPETAKANYIAAGEQFEKAISSLGALSGITVDALHKRPIKYFLNIELANCLFFSKVPEYMVRSQSIYQGLKSDFPDDPTVRLRLGNAIGGVSPRDPEATRTAIDLIRSAIPLIERDPFTGPNHWLGISCYVHIGFLEWRLSTLAAKDAGNEFVTSQLEKAIDSTLHGYDRWTKLEGDIRSEEIYILSAHKAISNVLYYSAKLIMINPRHTEINQHFIEKHIKNLSLLNVPAYKEYYKTRDNIMHAWVALGRIEEAQSVARENVSDLRKRAETRAGRALIATELDSYLDEDELKNFRTAASVLADLSNKA